MTDRNVIPRAGLPGFLARFLASLAVATVVVVTVVALGVRYYHSDDDDQTETMPDLNEVRVISLKDNPELARMIREARDQPADPLREMPEPVELPEREIQGFVQLEYTVNPDGSVSNVRVVGAAPAGVFEERALERVRNSMHAPAYEDGEPVARRTTEVIEFSVPSSELQAEPPADN